MGGKSHKASQLASSERILFVDEGLLGVRDDVELLSRARRLGWRLSKRVWLPAQQRRHYDCFSQIKLRRRVELLG